MLHRVELWVSNAYRMYVIRDLAEGQRAFQGVYTAVAVEFRAINNSIPGKH